MNCHAPEKESRIGFVAEDCQALGPESLAEIFARRRERCHVHCEESVSFVIF
jgi:hypothetical protein